jgi:hypothetical protein
MDGQGAARPFKTIQGDSYTCTIPACPATKKERLLLQLNPRKKNRKKTPSESRGELNPLSKRKKLVLLHAILLKEIDGAEMITLRMKFTWFYFH